MARKRVSAYNISAPCLISPPGPSNPILGLVGFIAETAGSAGNLVFNDAATLAAASAANQIISYTYQQALIGTMPIGDGSLPISTGLVISSVPTGMVLTVVYEIYVAGPA
jgi:hypothetical protein